VLEHRAIADRVIAGDAKGAVEAMRAHLGTVMEVLGEIAARHAEYFVESGPDDPARHAHRGHRGHRGQRGQRAERADRDDRDDRDDRPDLADREVAAAGDRT
jgi:hypothetical protein